tara:strand:- start:1635 stop:1880 length:246 start_codon:yes stop_codon:yes gene_type:complete
MDSNFKQYRFNNLDIQYSRKIIPQVGFVCGILFTVSGLTGIMKSLNRSESKNTRYLWFSSIGLLISGYYLISYFNEYNKHV